MTDPEAKIRAALSRLLQRCRTVPSVPGWVDEAVSEIREAIGAPSGVVTADSPEAAAALVALKERAERMEALAGEMLAAFTKQPNGWSARVKADQIEEWRGRLGEGG
jgi:ubiquinone biosynthesis protein COQ9